VYGCRSRVRGGRCTDVSFGLADGRVHSAERALGTERHLVRLFLARHNWPKLFLVLLPDLYPQPARYNTDPPRSDLHVDHGVRLHLRHRVPQETPRRTDRHLRSLVKLSTRWAGYRGAGSPT